MNLNEKRGTINVKNPGLAAILSFFICGLGQIYNGQIAKGIALFTAAGNSAFLCTIVIWLDYIAYRLDIWHLGCV